MPSLAVRLRHDIDHALHVRSAAPGTVAAEIEGALKDAGQKVWTAVRKRPSVGVVAVGGIALVAALEIGVGEVAFAVAAGYAAYEVLRKGMPVGEAIADLRNMVR